MKKEYELVIGGVVMHRGTKKSCYEKLNELMEKWLDSLPDESTIEVRAAK